MALYLPGYLLGRRLLRKDDGILELALLRVSASLAIAGPLLTLLALTGWFTGPVIVGSLGACAVAAFLGCRGPRARARATAWDLVGLALVAGSLALYSRPAEYVINSRDPGVYTLFADKLARTGALLHRDPLVVEVVAFLTLLVGNYFPGL